MTIHLVRHAQAGNSDAWAGDDLARPLTAIGRDQAAALSGGFEGVERIISSPALRCVQTVAQLAARVGLEVGTDDRLLEDADAGDTMALLDELAGGTEAVVCSHGPVMWNVVRCLRLRGLDMDGPDHSAKAGWWSIDLADGERGSARYSDPPSL
ncbi:MAG: phosphoglycerate mutase family protein [Actinomycetota bacterium]|nr:phosphoglycerate mutase family protein [Actinomycetota bacterium]